MSEGSRILRFKYLTTIGKAAEEHRPSLLWKLHEQSMLQTYLKIGNYLILFFSKYFWDFFHAAVLV